MSLSFRAALLAACLGVAIGCSTSSPHASVASPSTQPALSFEPLPSPRSHSETIAAVRKDIFWLADDAREGRGVGSDGLAQTGEYIANRFAHFGLKPFPGNDSYFQSFDYDLGGKVSPESSLAANGTSLDAKTFTGLVRSKPADVEGKLAFLGYGITNKEKNYDDFANIDVKDRVVLIMRWEPVDANGKSVWSQEDWSRHAAMQRKVSNAIDAGAKAVILVNAPTHHDDAEPLMSSQANIRRGTAVPVFHLTVDAANQLLAQGGAPTLAELQAKIDSSQTPSSLLLDSVNVHLNLKIEKDTSSVRNVIAYLPGKGPHADEYVVIGAHYDHVGRGNYGSRGGNGQIHNGADDNASGTTAMLALAENFALTGQQDRSIVFVAFTLEELGLIGSRKLVDSDLLPLDKTVAMLNLDMVGRVKDEHLYVGGMGTAASFEPMLNIADERSPITIRNMGKGGRGPSDHANFSSKKIPVLFFFSGMHPDYHAPGDDPEKINCEGIAQVVDFSFDIVQRMCRMTREEYVAQYDGQQPDTNVIAGGEPGKRQQDREMIEPDRPRLGIVPDYQSEPRTDGVLISGVTDNTAAQAAGLRAGDVVTALNDQKIAGLEDVVAFLNGAKVGDKVRISVLRDGATLVLESTLKGRPASN